MLMEGMPMEEEEAAETRCAALCTCTAHGKLAAPSRPFGPSDLSFALLTRLTALMLDDA